MAPPAPSSNGVRTHGGGAGCSGMGTDERAAVGWGQTHANTFMMWGKSGKAPIGSGGPYKGDKGSSRRGRS
eukprot:1921915-Pyramimonas_sp.AAC.1